MQIGMFTREANGFIGQVHTLTLACDLAIIPAEPSETENAPDYRVHQGGDEGPEVGAGWMRTGERAGEYVALVIDDPAFPHPIRANLFRDNDAGSAWSLHWSRPSKRDDKD
jgi:uncharacterized protein (DUF736 family)